MKPSLFADCARADLYHLPSSRRREALRAVAQSGLTLRESDLGRCMNAGEALTHLGRDLCFPEWYGSNFDALHDCLGDPEWLGNGQVVVIDGLAPLCAKDRTAFTTLLEVLSSAAESSASSGLPLWIVLDAPAPGVADLPEA